MGRNEERWGAADVVRDVEVGGQSDIPKEISFIVHVGHAWV